MSNGRREEGFTYLGVIFLVAAVGAWLAATGEIWSHSRQREKEAELLWVGSQFRQAIGLYYQRTPGAVKRYPEKLQDLLEDRRYLSTQRYLRRIYNDPMSGTTAWGLVPATGGGIMGVYSLSNRRPIKSAGLTSPQDFTTAMKYAEWRFVYEPVALMPSR